MDFATNLMREEESPKTSERLTEELHRQDWQERVSNLEASLKFVNQEI